ncbi:MbcA/ParS/Xre antitoxin family protein [Salipiger sp. H15]|uniref:MbcA/ParS/Xre antitoxin family protein n=1 Tax=Alloyangia sp. H15 TaxID=3029062 RepID=UPI003364C8A8
MVFIDHQSDEERIATLELIELATRWAGGSEARAIAWFTSQPLPSFGGQTAADLVRDGRAEAVRRYLSRIGVGGFS